jgi:hypothetical protein
MREDVSIREPQSRSGNNLRLEAQDVKVYEVIEAFS